jgi:hypothetical protein
MTAVSDAVGQHIEPRLQRVQPFGIIGELHLVEEVANFRQRVILFAEALLRSQAQERRVPSQLSPASIEEEAAGRKEPDAREAAHHDTEQGRDEQPLPQMDRRRRQTAEQHIPRDATGAPHRRMRPDRLPPARHGDLLLEHPPKMRGRDRRGLLESDRIHRSLASCHIRRAACLHAHQEKLEPQPHVRLAFGFTNLKPEPCNEST